MKGWVTWVFALLLIFAGMAMLLLSLRFPLHETVLAGMGLQCIGIGGGLIGIGRKIEKQTEVIQNGKDIAPNNSQLDRTAVKATEEDM